MIADVLYNLGKSIYLHKYAGGPGSGVKGYNTVTHPLPKSKIISVGTRKGMLDHMDYEEGEIDVHDITHSCQDKYVPEKIQKFMKNPEIVTKSPIDVLKGENGELTVVDGNHRYIAAMNLGISKLKARIFKSRKSE